jgi:hypothetical protein
MASRMIVSVNYIGEREVHPFKGYAEMDNMQDSGEYIEILGPWLCEGEDDAIQYAEAEGISLV